MLLAQIEAKLLKLAQRNLDHAAKHAEELGEDFQNKLDFLSEFDASKGNGNSWSTH
jgi:hypothetical protein